MEKQYEDISNLHLFKESADIRKIVVKCHQSSNYMRIKNKHIFLGINEVEEKIFTNLLNLKTDMKIHVFVYNEDAINEYLFSVLNYFNENNQHPRTRFVLHIPKVHEDLVAVLRRKCPVVEEKPFQILTERRGVSFGISNTNTLDVRYLGKSIESAIVLTTDTMNATVKDPVDETTGRAIDLFKDEIIARFKAVTPLGILKSFTNEEDIWDFVCLSGEWKKEN